MSTSRGFIGGLLLFSAILLAATNLCAQPSPRPALGKRTINSSSGSYMAGSSLDLNTTFDDLVENKGQKSYDPGTLWIMQGLKDITQPFWDPLDVDYERNDRAVEKAFTIQAGRAASQLVNNSELKPTFIYLKQQLSELKSIFNYSLQDSGNGLTVSNGKKGKKLLELSMEFNLSQGLDPNIRLGEHLRFRYDYVNRRPLLEYGINF